MIWLGSIARATAYPSLNPSTPSESDADHRQIGYPATMSIDDIDICRLAQMLVVSHGDGAAENAADRAERFAGEGDSEGEVIWRRVVAAIGELQRTESDGVVH